MLELYHAGRTTCSRKARLCLAEKGLDYVSHYMNLGAFENHAPEYLKLNPNGVVPTLVHDGRVIIEPLPVGSIVARPTWHGPAGFCTPARGRSGSSSCIISFARGSPILAQARITWAGSQPENVNGSRRSSASR